jgi:hypothetical protein
MQRGGWMAYYGPIGSKGRQLVEYIERLPGVKPCPAGMNPASWMLDVLSGSDSSGHHVETQSNAAEHPSHLTSADRKESQLLEPQRVL